MEALRRVGVHVRIASCLKVYLFIFLNLSFIIIFGIYYEFLIVIHFNSQMFYFFE